MENEEQNQSKPATPQEQAGLIAERLESLLDRVDQAGETDTTLTSRDRVLALLSDSQSLAIGLREGWITKGQPRLAANLVKAVELLETTRQADLSAAITYVLGDISSFGLAAEDSPVLKSRPPPRYDAGRDTVQLS